MELFKLVGEVALNGTDNVKNELDDISDKGEQSENRLISAFKKIGSAVATYFAVNKITNFGMEIARVSAEVGAESSAFAQIMGDYSQQAKEKMQQVADATGVMSTRLTPYMTSMTAKFKGLGYGINDATTFATQGLLLASDASAFWDMSLDESMSHLNSFINGSYEGGEAIGLFANDTQMAQYAIKTGLIATKTEWANLDEAIKQATRLEYAQAMMEASGAVGQARKEAGQYANQSADLTEKWRQFKAEIGEPILQNIVVPAMQKLSEIIDKLSQGYKDLKVWVEDFRKKIEETKQWCEEHQTLLTIIAIAIGGVTTALIAYNAAAIAKAIADGAMTVAIWAYCTATTVATTVTTAFGAVIAFLTSPITLIILGITALIATIVLLWNKCDWFREGIINIVEIIKNILSVAVQFIGQLFNLLIDIILIPWNFIWQNFGDTIMKWINVAKEWLNNVFEFIKGIFTSIWNTITNVFNSIKTTITNIITGIKNKVVEIFTNIKDGISEKINAVKTTVTDVFNKVKSAITEPIENAKKKVGEVVDNIKSMFKFNVSLPKIKLPHFAVTPKGWELGDLLKGKVPKLGIEWYAKAMDKGMILDEPTIFGINSNGVPMGAGEAGSETVVGTNSLMNMINKAVKGNTQQVDNSGIEKKLDKIMDLMLKMKIELDDEVVGNFVVKTVEKEVFN